ncbi:MAG: HD family hydrolase [Sedimentitalea sp.]
MTTRLEAQFAFLGEMDRLKSVSRATLLHDGSRAENSAEHSWHIMLHALVLAEHADPPVQIDHVLRLLMVHDIVEIDAGDAPIHGVFDAEALARAEAKAADRLFALLPSDQTQQLRALWDEFEAAQTPEARFAKAIDRVPAPLANIATGGGSWRDYGVTLDQLDTRVGVPIARGAPAIWGWLRPKIQAFFNAS